MRQISALVFTVSMGVATAAWASDIWDTGGVNDNSSATPNDLVHGSDQIHSLEALGGAMADYDWYHFDQRSFSSYEVVVDATSGNFYLFSGQIQTQRVDGGGVLAQDSTPITSTGYSRSLRWEAGPMPSSTEFIRVTASSCAGLCGSDVGYRIRFYETTYAVPRFNNTGTQVTVLLVQNPTDYAVTGTVYFWDNAGNQLATSPLDLAPHGLRVLNTKQLMATTSAAGSITISNTARYGDLAIKTTVLDTGTGFSFDTPGLPRPR